MQSQITADSRSSTHQGQITPAMDGITRTGGFEMEYEISDVAARVMIWLMIFGLIVEASSGGESNESGGIRRNAKRRAEMM